MIRTKKLFVIALASMLVMFLFNSQIIFSNETVQAKSYSGEEIFKGLFFAAGDASELFTKHHHPDVRDHVLTDEEKEVIDKIINEMNAVDGNYFANFERAIYSKDLPQVEALMEEGGKLVVAALENLDMMVAEGEYDTAAAVAGPLAVVAAGVHMYAAATHSAAATVTVIVYLGFWFWGPDSSEVTSYSLNQQELVVDVVETLN